MYMIYNKKGYECKKKICPKLGLRSRSKLRNNSFMAVLAYIYFLIIRKDFTC